MDTRFRSLPILIISLLLPFASYGMQQTGKRIYPAAASRLKTLGTLGKKSKGFLARFYQTTKTKQPTTFTSTRNKATSTPTSQLVTPAIPRRSFFGGWRETKLPTVTTSKKFFSLENLPAAQPQKDLALMIDTIQANDINGVKYLIDRGVDINRHDGWQKVPDQTQLTPELKKMGGMTPLAYAVINKKNDIAELLLKEGADVPADFFRYLQSPPIYFEKEQKWNRLDWEVAENFHSVIQNMPNDLFSHLFGRGKANPDQEIAPLSRPISYTRANRPLIEALTYYWQTTDDKFLKKAIVDKMEILKNKGANFERESDMLLQRIFFTSSASDYPEELVQKLVDLGVNVNIDITSSHDTPITVLLKTYDAKVNPHSSYSDEDDIYDDVGISSKDVPKAFNHLILLGADPYLEDSQGISAASLIKKHKTTKQKRSKTQKELEAILDDYDTTRDMTKEWSYSTTEERD